MRHFAHLVAVAAILLPGVVFAQAGIRNSKHDLSNSSTAVVKSTAANNQICIFCHTPHKAQSTQLLWNHTQTAVATYSWGNDLSANPLTATTQGTPLPTTLRGQSKICLGCHDGSIALGNVSNAGGGVAGTIAITALAGRVDAAGLLLPAGGYTIGVGGSMGGHHPVSIPYAGQTGYNGIASSATGDGTLGNYYSVVTTGCTSASGLCTNAGALDGRNGLAINLLPNAAGATTNLGIECSSCHEPHNKTGFANFTLVNNSSASGLCRSCHNK
ncbi:MAG TPA: cytochrome c3 family protein [Myxococcales bacterium]|jgi:predicted CXXCH cytochrome family protein